ncbi:TetR family transcriptional regulator [Streptomyces sp. 2A115]|uniref:TetR family transcriptional regulator n=1 Tax=Streptomyces sp. 2A115 TaxID=3457439 RepID=UPI003FD3B889
MEEGGPDAVSTRAVAAAAGVPAPSVFRLFGTRKPHAAGRTAGRRRGIRRATPGDTEETCSARCEVQRQPRLPQETNRAEGQECRLRSVPGLWP